MSARGKAHHTPLIDAKRQIVGKARWIAAISCAGVAIVTMFMVLNWISANTQSPTPFPILGVPGDTALAIVSICAVVVIGIVLGDASGRYDRARVKSPVVV
ncbi:hypothetical protein [Marisediminicola senii]|uniref:hypothetical protein n=1 Tax=Marisediminicola senii TaxID=2711233 RepID=UPI0013EB8FB5|nr:hypothetical protein [Marisediminicola senii]